MIINIKGVPMSYKEEIIIRLAREEDVLKKSVADIFEKALSHTKQTGQSLESIVYEILEGIEESKKGEELLIQSTDNLAHILLENTKDEMTFSYNKYMKAEAVHSENIAKQYALADELMETVVHYAKEHNHKKLLKRCREKKSLFLENIDEIIEKVGYNHGLNNKDNHA